MGKNTLMKRCIRLYCERTGSDQWATLLDALVGNVGVVFTKGDLNEVCNNSWSAANTQRDMLRQAQRVGSAVDSG